MIMSRIEKLADIIMENNNSNVDKDIIVYGLISTITQGVSIIITILLGIIFQLILESLVFLISYSIIRMYAGGYHCKEAIQCYVISTGIMVTVLTIVKITPIWYIIPISVFIFMVSVPILLTLAPLETTNKPLDEVEREHYRKKTILHLSIEYCIMPILFWAELHTLAFVMSLGILITTGVVFLQYQINKGEKIKC